MATFILRRLLQTVIVLLIVTMLVFLIMQLLPGDPARIMLGSEATQEQIDLLREEMGLDQPLPVQYLHWLGNVLQGDLGKSLYYKDAVTGTIATRLPITLQLGIYSLLLALLIGIPAGDRRRQARVGMGFRRSPDFQFRDFDSQLLARDPGRVFVQHAAWMAAGSRLCIAMGRLWRKRQAYADAYFLF